ncbi:hypothetical protein FRC11_006420 [Ceratobasidium sp. 423]|nr:hypothetical protein FRC11_006420 [Ceratobasidium sp. 423]
MSIARDDNQPTLPTRGMVPAPRHESMHAEPPSVVRATQLICPNSASHTLYTTTHPQQVPIPASRPSSRPSPQIPQTTLPTLKTNPPGQHALPARFIPSQTQPDSISNQTLHFDPTLQVVSSHTSSMAAGIQASPRPIQPIILTQPAYSAPPIIDTQNPLGHVQAIHPYSGRSLAALPPLRATGSQPPHSGGTTFQPQINLPDRSGVHPGSSLAPSGRPIGVPQPLEQNQSEQRPRKRLRNSDFKPNNNGTLFDGGIIQLPAVASSFWGNKTSIQDQLINATRQLSKPRSTPGPSGDREQTQNKKRRDSKGKRPTRSDVDDGGELEELSEVAQEEGAEITRSVYEDDLEDENGPAMRRVYRLMSRMIQKQEALRNSLEAMQQGKKSGDTTPPRISPAKARKEVNWDQSIACTEPAGRQPRIARQVLIAKIIRMILMGLCKRKSNKDPIVPPPANVRVPSLEKFFLQCEETETSLFNCLAAKIVVEEVKKYWSEHYKETPLTKAEIDSLPYKVSEHIGYTCATYRDSVRENTEELRKLKLKRASAASRRATLYHSRLKVIDRFGKALGMHRLLIVVLGLVGTSSDEEDSMRRGTYLIKNRVELSTRVQVLKREKYRKLDLLYALYFKGPGTRGSQMHIRVPSDLPSCRTFAIEGLPITCLSHKWLRSLSDLEREFYQFTPHKYNYSFPDVLLRRNVQPDPSAIIVSEDEDESEPQDDRDMEDEEL